MKRDDYIAPPCACPQCLQAGVDHLELRRDWHTGQWLHGYALKRWYESWEAFRKSARAAVGAKGRHANGFEPLVTKGQD